ncbi:MAG TPA: hypothetical protein VFY96_01670 [Candidatus Binatia bacterium]|nr:hypothetical protein [Candidatus Binatia bacterium]
MAYVLLLTFAIILSSRVQAASVLSAGNCPDGVDFEKSGYSIRFAHVESPFQYVSALRTAIKNAEVKVTDLAGRPYRNREVRKRADELEGLNFLPDAIEQPVRVSVVITSVENCSTDRLDLVFTVFTTQVAPLLSRTFESYQLEKFAPERSAGIDAGNNPWRFSPSIAYDRAEQLSGGARLEYRNANSVSSNFPFGSVIIEGRGSARMHDFSAALSGSVVRGADWIEWAEWQLNYRNASNPTEESSLRQNRLVAQLTATTRPLGSVQLPLRFGGQLEGGTLRSHFADADLARNTIEGSSYGALKFYLGTTMRLDRHAFAFSYGLELGSTRPGAEIGWLKHIADVAHDVSFPVGDHRSLEIESRLTAGIIQVPGSIPAAARFYGGNREEPFMPGDNWNIRSNPVIRSIPADHFSQTDNGRGGTRFISYNMTAGIPIWRRPLVPPELSHDSEFTDELNGQLQTVTSLLQPDFAAKDPHFQRVAAQLDEVQSALDKLLAIVSTAQPSAPEPVAQQFKACSSALNTAKRRVQAAAQSKGAAQYGDVSTLLTVNETEDRLNKVRSACLEGLNSQLQDVQIAAAADSLEEIHSRMEKEFAQIDQSAASKQAESEMSYGKRTLNSILYEMNFLSLGPILLFDVARMSPAGSKLGTRYGIGGGLRFTLISHVDFTIGYAANPKRITGQPPGAFFFSMRFKDLLN